MSNPYPNPYQARREHAFDYAFIMDADTAVNRTNLEAFVRPLPAKESVYTGFCKRRWSALTLTLTLILTLTLALTLT